jgi:anaerobic magnesium-protoporphyrin IX monomethyl ester cyclase
MSQLDLLIVNPNSSREVYQCLSDKYSAIEPPTWSLLLAESCRSKGFSVEILDAEAERLDDEEAEQRIFDANPRLLLFCIYGQNPNSGTTNMSGAYRLCEFLSMMHRGYYRVAFVGSHTSALPHEVLSNPAVDFVLPGDGVYALHNLLRTNLHDVQGVKGIMWKDYGVPMMNPPEKPVPESKMDVDLPGYAWDLLPYKDKPLDLYRAHFWHADFDYNKRTPFVSIYTSLGCRFKCDFCMINIINRDNYEEGKKSADFNTMRFWSPEWALNELEKLAKLGVETVRLADEMFFLDKRYFEPFVQGIVDRGLKMNMWAYSRIDTVREKYLELFKKAGINWLALGVEAGNQMVRKEVAKGSFKDINIREVVSEIHQYDINIISNYIFGFPDDTQETMQQTLDLALELNTEMANMYPCQALPGSPLYYEAKLNGWELPSTFSGYSFLSYDSNPLRTKHCTAAEVLRFRDDAWTTYFSNPAYLDVVEKRFGAAERQNVIDMSKLKLKRKILGD